MNKNTRLFLLAVALVAAAVLAVNSSQAATLTAEWDYPADKIANVDEFRVYEIVGTGAPVLVATSAKNGTTPAAQSAEILNVVPAVHTYVVTASNAFWGESARSNEASTPGAATPPGLFKVRISTKTIGRAGIKVTTVEYLAVNDTKPGKGNGRK